MFKKIALERFVARANSWQYDYGDGLKSLPLLSQDPADPLGTYTANVPLLSVPLVGDLEHRGDKFKYPGIATAAPTQDTDWDSVPTAMRTEIREAFRKAPLGQQGGNKFDNTPTKWTINFGAENARMGIPTWGSALGNAGTVTFKVIFRDKGNANNHMMLCDDAGLLDSHVRRSGVSGFLEWDTVRWYKAKVNGVDAPTQTTPLEYNKVYEIEMTTNGNTRVRWIGEGPSSASDEFLEGSITDLVFTKEGDNRAYDMVLSSDIAPTASTVRDTVGGNDATLVDFGSRPFWTVSPF